MLSAFSLQVKVGDVVAEGEQLVTMSAMKMETAIPAPRDGIIDRITVNAGDKVHTERKDPQPSG